jgi:hypothetical protein
VARGYGYSFLNLRPRNMASLDGLPLAYVPLERRYRPMQLGLASLAEYRKTRLVAAFAEHCRTAISDDSIPGMRTSRAIASNAPPAPTGYGGQMPVAPQRVSRRRVAGDSRQMRPSPLQQTE